MEPDHSGSISLIKKYYPNITIVGNKQTFDGRRILQHLAGSSVAYQKWRFAGFGLSQTRFYLTPMVHWPETMMTFDETEGLLFSGDGFGAFGTSTVALLTAT